MPTSQNPSPRRRPRPEYLAGRDGVRVTWDDGTVTTYPPGSIVRLHAEAPRKAIRLEGRALIVGTEGLGFEAPALVNHA